MLHSSSLHKFQPRSQALLSPEVDVFSIFEIFLELCLKVHQWLFLFPLRINQSIDLSSNMILLTQSDLFDLIWVCSDEGLTPNPTGEKHTESSFVDQTRIPIQLTRPRIKNPTFFKTSQVHYLIFICFQSYTVTNTLNEIFWRFLNLFSFLFSG